MLGSKVHLEGFNHSLGVGTSVFNEVRTLREEKAVEERIRDNIPLVHFVIAKSISVERDSYRYEEIYSYGLLGLYKAAVRFNPALGYRFSTFATSCIRSTIGNLFLKEKAKKDVFCNGRMQSIIHDETFSITKNLHYTRGGLEEQERKERSEKLWRAIKILPMHYRKTLILMYGLKGKKMSASALSEYLGISIARVHQIKKSAEAMIRKLLRSKKPLPKGPIRTHKNVWSPRLWGKLRVS